MFKLVVFDAHEYEIPYFKKFHTNKEVEITFVKEKLSTETQDLARGHDAVCVFVNDSIVKETVDFFKANGIKLILTRSIGFNHIDLKAAKSANILVMRVPAYSAYSVAEYALALLLGIVRKVHVSYQRVKKHNFSIAGLNGFDINGKKVGIIGSGRIGKVFGQIISAMGAEVLLYDPYPDHKFAKSIKAKYLSFEEVLKESDIISIHSPLMESTYHLINKKTIAMMKKGVIIINVARGGIIDTEALIEGLESKHIQAAGLDVYEYEQKFFFEDFANKKLNDPILKKLISLDNVLISAHTAFFTKEAQTTIYQVTMENLDTFLHKKQFVNEVKA